MRLNLVANVAKPFTWSFSRLKNFETCPKKHYEVDIQKNFSEGESEQLKWGNQVHAAMAAALQGAPLPPEMASYQKWIDVVLAGPGKLLVEQKYAITRDFQPTAYFAPNVWYRGIGDVVRIDGPVGLVLDWKTGAIKIDSVQLMLMAQCIFTHYPQLQRVRSEYVWLQEDASTPEVYSREDLADGWIGLMDRVSTLEDAAKTLSYPPKPSGLCKKWCPVKSCPYWGKGNH